MSKNKGYNSIFFITTLGVYLGLVLVGASPSVLAQQAALTPRFEIQNEIDVEDDLDKKPEDESPENYLSVRLDDALQEFLASGESGYRYFSASASIDRSEFEVNISFSQNRPQAPLTAVNPDTLFSIKALNAQTGVTKQFYENTRAKAENQYVRIVTCLPRGSLDAPVTSKGQAYRV